ncbi:MAG: gamma-glutamyltransferase [Bdellovibrio sp.]|nr:MAG: gamma-glutamyltransferase [Bdellovibrio sp.]
MKRIFFVVLFYGFFVKAVPFEGSQIVISGPNHYAIEAGTRMAEKGGNVVDVAVTVGLVLSVTNPYHAALGGGGFALIKMKGHPVVVLDFREVAPASMDKNYYLSKGEMASRLGGTAVGVPGFPAGLWAMHQKYGKLKWKTLFKEALHLAKNGFRVSGEWVDRVHKASKHFSASGGKKFFLKKGKVFYRPGEVLRQKALYQALKLFRNKGASGFYKGRVAQDIVLSVNNAGGEMTLKDLENYQVKWRQPMEASFYNYHLYLMPPPSSGGVVIKTALYLLEHLHPEKFEAFSGEEYHLIGEILSRSFRGRALLGDPDFYSNPLKKLLSEKYLSFLKKSISQEKAIHLKPLDLKDLKESSQTTHYSILNKDGDAVSLTVTLNGNFGSGVVSEKYGIALNNEMDDFTTHPGKPNMYGLIQGSGNYVQAGKRPLSSMSPTLVEKDRKIVMSLGAPGGPRIISGVIQVLYRTLVRKMDMDSAIQARRVHHQFLPKVLFVDEVGFSPDTIRVLEKKGHQVKRSWNSRVYGVWLKPSGILEGAFDSRGDGAVSGF